MTGLDRADTDAIALLENLPLSDIGPGYVDAARTTDTLRAASTVPPAPVDTVGAADTLPDGQNAGVAGRVKRLCNWWANLFADKRRLMAPA